ncbi:vitamin B12 dependent-methionine synthase activation domain-containing protein [Clostridium sp. E02]|uniref:vitamin B12 dependent-methionine synthase activation domain-containing protein n=1 Tax=Clostridium sp. E02 TaxID=2487134 RepID=UPI0019D0FB62|nr:vitamin B12 dependent-methionine synthase activation domain-containing protein [Clostridium sp. E02]
MEVSQKEILRYLGYKGNAGDEQVNALIIECLEELEEAASLKSIHRTFPLQLLPDDEIDFSVFRIRSHKLSKNLTDCDQVILFAATLGTGVDLKIKKYSKLQMSKAVVMQAAATAMIEEFCDIENRKLKEAYEAEGFFLRPRFSPGYGDFPLECQKDMTTVLETPKRIGIMLTESLLMIPSKSVTAVIGVSKKPLRCESKGCESCKKTDCAYRRNG